MFVVVGVNSKNCLHASKENTECFFFNLTIEKVLFLSCFKKGYRDKQIKGERQRLC